MDERAIKKCTSRVIISSDNTLRVISKNKDKKNRVTDELEMTVNVRLFFMLCDICVGYAGSNFSRLYIEAPKIS